MQKLAIFGKGGIGKSTFAASLAVLYARRGLRVILVGCDPKHDTTVALTDGKPIGTVVDHNAFMNCAPAEASRLVVRARLGIDCVEAGGPEPGIGCAGRGISRMIEILEDGGLLRQDRYDVALFDVLGDVVCGGFAAPLRKGFADKVCIVVSEELMALYAANNIARAIRNYGSNGASLCGLVVNLRDPGADRGAVERFAKLIGTRVLAFLERDTAVRQAEYRSITVVEHAPESPFAREMAALADRLLAVSPAESVLPTPLADVRFHALGRRQFVDGAPAVATEAPAPAQEQAPSEAAPPSAAVVPDENEAPAPRSGVQEDLAAAAQKSRGPDEEGPNARQWGAPDQWRRFFCDSEAQRNARAGLEVDAPILNIQHQDLECSFATPDFGGGQVSYFNFPWPRAVRDPVGREHDEPQRDGGRTLPPLVTDLRDLDVIHGGGRKLGETLEAAIGRAEGTLAIVVHSTCVPTVIGDDAEAILDRYRDRVKVPIVHTNPAANQHVDVARMLFDRVKASPEFAATPRRERCVNLVGFPEGSGLREIVSLLGDVGIEVNARVMPALDMARARHYLAAGVQVFYPNAAYEDVYREVFLPLPIGAMAPEAPYGLEGTRRWVTALAARFDLERRADAALRAAMRPFTSRWRAARREASGHRLAFVVDRAHVARLTDPSRLWGVPVIQVLEEMGFGVDILFHDHRGGGQVAGFSTPAELNALLRDGRFAAVYSEYFFDERLTRAGKAQFSLDCFEMGIGGALRGAAKLGRIARWPFYRRYARHLGRA